MPPTSSDTLQKLRDSATPRTAPKLLTPLPVLSSSRSGLGRIVLSLHRPLDPEASPTNTCALWGELGELCCPDTAGGEGRFKLEQAATPSHCLLIVGAGAGPLSLTPTPAFTDRREATCRAPPRR